MGKNPKFKTSQGYKIMGKAKYCSLVSCLVAAVLSSSRLFNMLNGSMLSFNPLTFSFSSLISS